jgi:hypothetical protein
VSRNAGLPFSNFYCSNNLFKIMVQQSKQLILGKFMFAIFIEAVTYKNNSSPWSTPALGHVY